MTRSSTGLLALAFLLAIAAGQTVADDAGASAYQRCAACHLAGGEGVPGAFPPLTGRIAEMAVTPDGRQYLIAVVNSGLMGSITIDGISYMSVMPAQGSLYDEQGISDVLNYSIQVLDAANISDDWQPFTLQEVVETLSTQKGSSAMSNARMREALYAKYPALP